MEHSKRLTMKLLANGLPLFLLLALPGKLNWAVAAMTALLITAAAYIIVDFYILPGTGNIVASLAEAGLVFLLLWAASLAGISISIMIMLYSSLAVALVEGLLFHPYLKRPVGPAPPGPE